MNDLNWPSDENWRRTVFCSLHSRLEPIRRVRRAQTISYVPGAHTAYVKLDCGQDKFIVTSTANLNVMRAQLGRSRA